MQEEFDQITRVVQQKAETLTGELDQLTTRLTTIEAKIPDMCISDISLLFLNKEVNKNNEMANGMIDGISAVLEDINSFRILFKSRQNQEVYLEEIDQAKDMLKRVERMEAQDYPKLV